MNLVRRAALSQFLTCMPWTLSRGPPGKISLCSRLPGELLLHLQSPKLGSLTMHPRRASHCCPELDHVHLDYKMRGLSDHSFRLSQLTVVLCVDHLVIYLLLLLDFESPEGAVSNPEFFNYGVEAYEAFKKGALTSDIIDEQKKVQEADLVIFQFPLYWFSMPAILKGWMDRVLCQGFAFDIPGFYDSGFLKNKLALLSLTTGSTAEMYMKTGVSGDYRYFLWPLQHGALHFCGFKVLAPQISFAPEIASEEERKAMVASWAQRLKTIWEEEPIDCTPPWYFGQ
ncbi:ribosyldihydronicotinamide dehydrogenase [quinone] isoform X1 [Felis catus]|uniref:N-ribosyldihydronicotinamide:quinone dehydrogenase 2 n=2 Tax=Felis catus TaxID=9685 RepID=A0ABI7XUE5_FELCA|nr:ribosyldihydronicotinamide dehydrogenase [quinone] isoform X1 [Felis catus]XP_044913124.1 ribosyldihydronicotinamide dehydrogenase [quinone] isoform X1 [Felis catus]XP_044913125.1 ribosyldihydronicotinamide dehydrogenase [quinone] isoform X1 [Felis catus]XP_044913126.1 ribosyldihydronicotinamide dehydrogenase [quinone] isoform X1 [Felis catus]